MKFGKRELIMSALVLALGTAVYVNWQFSTNDAKLNTERNDEDLGVAQYVNASVSPKDSDPKDSASKQTTESENKSDSKPEASKTESKPKENSSKNTSSVSTNTSEYFSKVRLERKQTQDELMELAQNVIEAADSSGKGKEEAVKHLNEMSDTIQQQSNVENLIIAKGFDDCVAFVQNGECSVVVTGQELKSDLLIAIKDIVMGQTGLSFDKIRVTHI